MGSKNNPKNRAGNVKKKVLNGKEIEPIVFYDTEKKLKYVSAKICKSVEVICDKEGNPVKWSDIESE